jgi:ankyrin repeat protein
MPRTLIGRALFTMVVCLLLGLIAVNLRRKIGRHNALSDNPQTITWSTNIPSPGTQELVDAIRSGDHRRAGQLIAGTKNLNATDQSGVTPLQAALIGPHPDLALGAQLLERGTSVNQIDRSSGYTLLLDACIEGSAEVARFLIDHGAGVDIGKAMAAGSGPVSAGSTPLLAAIHTGHLDLVPLLLNHGADPNLADRAGRTPLMEAGSSVEITSLLLEHHASVGPLTPGGFTPLMTAGTLEVIRLLLAHGADVNAARENGFTPLMMEVQSGKPECVQELLAHGANPNAKQAIGRTVLQVALYRGDARIVRLLLQHGADIHARGDYNGTPLQTALHLQRNDLAEILRQAGTKK